jgi:formate dehydrogenase major subunit
MVTIIIDGRLYSIEADQTLLDAAQACGVNIPSLCGTEGFNSHCGLCDVEVKGKGIVKACQQPIYDGMSVTTRSKYLIQHRKDVLQEILSGSNITCSVPPCQKACPAKVDIQSYLYFIAHNDHKKAIEITKKTLPMPLSIGRICPAFCEAKCQRNLLDEPVAIRQLKRHAADLDLNSPDPYIPERKPGKGKTIAIIGAGPGGLSCGYYLGCEGYDVTVFEAMPQPGGWLRYGIPTFRLPKDILDKEIELMCYSGMEIQTNKKLGTDFSLSSLSERYDAVCLAIGASRASEMIYPGSDLDGCFLGVDFLKDHMTVQQCKLGRKVAVIGGGNTAIDCARTVLRKGAETTLIYRRTRDEMPAEPYEIAEAELEGAQFRFLANPIENIADQHGRVCQVKFEKMVLGEPDASGRRFPQPTGETFIESFDTVIAAVSQRTDTEFLNQDTVELPLTSWNTIKVDEATMFTGVRNIFAIGDFRRGPTTAIEAVADGRRAAQAIDDLFGGDMEKLYLESFRDRNVERSHLIRAEHVEKLKAALRTIVPGKDQAQIEANLALALRKILRVPATELGLDERRSSFDEVEGGLEHQDAINEARRCLSCGCFDGNACRLRRYATEYQVDRHQLPTPKGINPSLQKSPIV